MRKKSKDPLDGVQVRVSIENADLLPSREGKIRYVPRKTGTEPWKNPVADAGPLGLGGPGGLGRDGGPAGMGAGAGAGTEDVHVPTQK